MSWRRALCCLAALLAGAAAWAQQPAVEPALAAAPPQAAAADGADPQPDYPPLQQEELYRRGLNALAEGRPEDAAELLVRFLEHEPQHAGAWLDLAISQCEMGNAVEAERLFKEIERRFAPPPGILEVIAEHRASGCLAQVVRPASWMLNLGRGHDSNVNQGASTPTFTLGTGDNQGQYQLAPEFLPQADDYSTLSGSYVKPLDSSGTLAILQAYVRHNDHVHDQDTASVLAGMEHAWNIGRWRARVTGAVGLSQLDGQLYQRQQQIQLRAAPPITLPANFDLALVSSFNHASYPTRDNYDGNTAELGVVLNYRKKREQLELSLSELHDHAIAARPGGDRDGWFGNLQWYTLLTPGLYGEAGLSHQYWQSQQIYSPGLIEVARRQNTSTVRAALQWYLRPGLSLYLEARVVRDRENISLFQYNSRALQLSLRHDNF